MLSNLHSLRYKPEDTQRKRIQPKHRGMFQGTVITKTVLETRRDKIEIVPQTTALLSWSNLFYFDNLPMCSTTRVAEKQVPKLRILVSLAKLLNSGYVFITSVTSHQITFLLNAVCDHCPASNSSAIYGWDCRPQITGFWLLYYFFLCIIAALTEVAPWNYEDFAKSSDWIDGFIWGCLPSLWLYSLPVMIHLCSFLVCAPIQLSVLAVLVMNCWFCFLQCCLVSLYWPYWWKSCPRKEVFFEFD